MLGRALPDPSLVVLGHCKFDCPEYDVENRFPGFGSAIEEPPEGLCCVDRARRK